jgi:hypothetical protein
VEGSAGSGREALVGLDRAWPWPWPWPAAGSSSAAAEQRQNDTDGSCNFGDGKLGGEFGRRRDGDGRAAWLPRIRERKRSEKLEEARCGEGAAQQLQFTVAPRHVVRERRREWGGEGGGSGMKTSERGAVARMRGSARPRVARHQ